MYDGTEPDERLEGMQLIGPRRPFNKPFNRKTLWAVTMIKLYIGYLRSGREPNYPKEPADYIRS